MNLFGIEEEREQTPEELAAAMAVKLNEEAGVTRGDIDAAAMEKLVGPTSFFDANKLSMPTMPMTRGEQEYETNPVAATLKKMLIPKPVYKHMYGQNSQYLGDVAKYELDSKLYLEQEKKGLLDKQDEAVAAHVRDVAAGRIPADPMELMALKIQANGVSPVNMNNTTLAAGARMVDVFGNLVAEGGEKDDRTSQERNLAARNALYARQPDQKNEPGAWAAWNQERNFFESSIRANMNVGNIVRSGVDGEVMGTEGDYIDSAAAMEGATTQAAQDVETSAKMFEQSQSSANEAYTAVENYDYSLGNAYKVRDGLADGTYTTNVAKSMLLKNMGLGGYSDGELAALGTDEAIAKVQGFNGHTTDFEYGEAFMAAFAQLKNGVPVNQGIMDAVIRGLENARENAGKALVTSTYDASNSASSAPEKRWVERKNSANKQKYPKAPDIGFEREGMRYMGGLPTDVNNWVEMSK